METLQDKLQSLLLKIHKKNKLYIPDYHTCKNYEKQIQRFCELQSEVLQEVVTNAVSKNQGSELTKTFKHLFSILNTTKWKLELYTGDDTLVDIQEEMKNLKHYYQQHPKAEKYKDYEKDLLARYNKEMKKVSYGYSLVLSFTNQELTSQIKTVLGYICVLLNETSCMFDIKDNKVVITTRMNNFISSLLKLMQFALYLEFFDLFYSESKLTSSTKIIVQNMIPQVKLNGVYNSKN